MSFRPRTVIVLAALTLTVGFVAFRFARQSDLRRLDGLMAESVRLFASSRPDAAPGPGRDPAEIEGTIGAITGARPRLPRDAEVFSFTGVARATIGKKPAAAVRLTYEGEPFLLVVVRKEAPGLVAGPPGDFAGPDFMSGEREGKSFVYWERDGTAFVLVSAVDLTRTFDLVRRYFS